MQKTSPKIYRAPWIILIVCQMVLMQCGKYGVLDPGPVILHLQRTGSGALNVSFSDTTVDYGTKISLKATPSPGSIFLGWYGDFSSTLDTASVFVTKNMLIEARFRIRPNAAGLVEIPSKNQTFLMGSNSAGAGTEEKPVHSVRFTYSYYIDNCAITQKQYSQLTGANPLSRGPSFGVGDSFPVYYVTWYEAALFCNARSKALGYDTVYSYTSVCGQNQTCPYVLENLSIHFDRFGFRLPTEAEWEFAARGRSEADYFWGNDVAQAEDYSWFSANSPNACQPVGHKKPNGFGLYDMAGNVSQWVNDRFGGYSSVPCVDPIGPTSLSEEDFIATSGQRPVRGGSWKTGTSFLRLSARKYAYPTPANSFAEYIGFRTVLGAFFPQPQDSVLPVIDTSGIVVPVTIASDLIRVVGTSSVKCVFTKDVSQNMRALYYIDFSESGRLAHHISDSLTVHNPVISPNGNYVAYSTNYEGFTGKSRATIRSLFSSAKTLSRTPSSVAAFLPRWWTDPATGDTFVVYVNSASLNNASSWKNEKTLREKIIDGTFSGSVQSICDSGSFHGGLSADGRFLGTGYPQAYTLNVKTNDLYQYFLPPQNGLSSPRQVCNVSISPKINSPDEIMFLDFGSFGEKSAIVGKPYAEHAIIFTCTSSPTTQAVQWFEKPSSFDSWNDVEWSNHPDFAGATAGIDADPEKTSLFIVNLKTKECLKLAEGKNLHDVYVWIDPIKVPAQTDPYPDFALYDVPYAAGGQRELTEKLKLFWARRNSLECIFVGSSPMLYGIDPSYITTVKALNMGTRSSNAMTSFVLATKYALLHSPGLKIVAIGLDPGQIKDFDYNDPYLTGLSRALGYDFDKANNFWQNGLPPEIQKKISLFDSASQWPNFYPTGFTNANLSGSWNPAIFDRGDFDFSDPVVQKNLSVYSTLADTLARRGIHVLVLEFPESPSYKQSDTIGRLGPSRETYQKIVSWLRNIEQENPYFHFYDANKNGDHDYTDAEAFDCNHLGYLGAKKMSMRVDSLFKLYLK